MTNVASLTNLLTVLMLAYEATMETLLDDVQVIGLLNVSLVVEYVMRDYDQHLLPDPNGVNVTLEIHVQEIGTLSELTSDFEVDIMYSEIWIDPRLSYANLSLCATNITLKSSFRQSIWTPLTVIINSKSSEIHKSPSENTFMILYEDGRIWANYRMKVKAPCRMNLIMFPFDSQQCTLIFESYSFNNEQVRLSWHEHPITMMGPMELPDFDLRAWKTGAISLPYPNGNWDRLNVSFSFTRRSGYYLFQAYFPTLLTVLSSFIGFLLDARSVSARITLGVSSLLAISFQFGTVLRHLPRVSYIKCLDVWMIACIIFIFGTIVELGVICQIARFEKEAELSTKCLIKWLENVRRRRGCVDTTAGLANGGAITPQGNAFATVLRLAKKKRSIQETTLDNPAFKDATLERPTSRYHQISRTSVAEGAGASSVPRGSRVGEPEQDDSQLCRRFNITAAGVDSAAVVGFPLSFAIFNLVYWGFYLSRLTKIEDMAH